MINWCNRADATKWAWTLHIILGAFWNYYILLSCNAITHGQRNHSAWKVDFLVPATEAIQLTLYSISVSFNDDFTNCYGKYSGQNWQIDYDIAIESKTFQIILIFVHFWKLINSYLLSLVSSSDLLFIVLNRAYYFFCSFLFLLFKNIAWGNYIIMCSQLSCVKTAHILLLL